jgi:hypothetical protein
MAGGGVAAIIYQRADMPECTALSGFMPNDGSCSTASFVPTLGLSRAQGEVSARHGRCAAPPPAGRPCCPR